MPHTLSTQRQPRTLHLTPHITLDRTFPSPSGRVASPVSVHVSPAYHPLTTTRSIISPYLKLPPPARVLDPFRTTTLPLSFSVSLQSMLGSLRKVLICLGRILFLRIPLVSTKIACTTPPSTASRRTAIPSNHPSTHTEAATTVGPPVNVDQSPPNLPDPPLHLRLTQSFTTSSKPSPSTSATLTISLVLAFFGLHRSCPPPSFHYYTLRPTPDRPTSLGPD